MRGAVVDNKAHILSPGHIREATLMAVRISHNEPLPIIRVKGEHKAKD